MKLSSPFPGMDPFLEGAKWPDVHHKLAAVLCELIMPFITPKYIASVETYIVNDTEPSTELGIMYPDVAVVKNETREPDATYQKSPNDDILTPVSITLPTISTFQVRIPVVEIRDQEKNSLITAIEILSPVNKRNPGLEKYRAKRQKLYESNIHLIEIDLLRRGTRPLSHPSIPIAHYYVTLVRALGKTQIWAFNIQNKMPVIPVPLKSPDEDILLNLGKALHLVYERNYYINSIDYSKNPPPPNFSKKEKDWIKDQFNK